MKSGLLADLSRQECQTRLCETDDPDAVRRLLAAIAFKQGLSPAEIEREYGFDRGDVRRWIERFAAEGIDAAYADPGAPRSRDSTQELFETEAQLRTLQQTTRALIGARSIEKIAEATLAATGEVLKCSSSFWRYDEDTEQLHLLRVADRSGSEIDISDDRPTTYARGEGPLWAAFDSGEEKRYDGVDDETDGHLRSQLVVPLGEYGVLQASSTDRAAFCDRDAEMARLLSVSVESALDRLEYEEKLQALQEITQELMVAQSLDDIGVATVRAAEGVLDISMASLWYYNEATDSLEHVRESAKVRRILDSPDAFERGSGLVWEVFASGDPRVYNDLREHEEVYNPDTPLRSELIAPVGEYGVILWASTVPNSFSEFDIEMSRILAANVEASFERLQREREMRENERDLARLERLFGRFLRHNLRNQLNVIKGFAQTIGARDDGQFETQVGKITEATDSVLEMSEKARVVEDIVNNDPAVVEHDLRSVVGRAVEAVETPSAASVTVDVPPDITVLAIPQITRAIQNLVDNSLAHGGAEPTVRITARRDGEMVRLVVEDDGPGIPESERTVFREGQESKLAHSSGIGLWLVTWVLQRSGGSLSFEIEDGTRAVVRLRAADAG